MDSVFNVSTVEKEKRQAQLLELSRSKQERTDSELANLREVRLLLRLFS